ncbi:hypothetical protein FGA82_17115 [Pseudomonas fluorescens]|uniref:hypothetical protein n=1 Tax=Pseudomonas fluorescens TaxID=294 RepID=UPI001131E15B|nr:hypothetical protein [Pseudomonas fluorescens]TMU77619.1 hypothetical protein FGA82_17115 [Pseudomonas fluorescens]
MNQYSYLNLIKREAKAYGKSHGISLALALEHIARESGFGHYHEMVAVSKTNPNDQRLMLRAVGLANFNEILFEDPLWGDLDSLVEDALSGPMAETNATGFIVENLEVSSADYDESTGVATLEVQFEYNGEQDQERVWHGAGFHLEGQIQLIFRGEWSLVNDDALLITAFKTDQDMDHEAGLDDLYEQFLASQNNDDKPTDDPFQV